MLNNPEVLNNFVECFKKEDLPMHRFCVEVTEDGDIPTDHLIPAIKLLKSHGFKIAMDDFGTGYSSLSRLSVLPVDVVKIDRSLLLAATAGDKAILESAITLTKRLGASTVVEGVETIEQLELIKELGADSVQGFLLSKPVTISKTPLLSLNMSDIVPEFLLDPNSNTVTT
jgi:EAL domain-containing protein (putative c-di-GMP-specific phosphodiesterase class I)